MTVNELEFATWCIGNVAHELQVDDALAYKQLKSSGILYDYIIGEYEVLHTFGKKYLMEDIIGLMKKRGVA